MHNVPDPSVPDPGTRPEEENLTADEIIAKYGADLKDAAIREQILVELVDARKLAIAVNRKHDKEHAEAAAWLSAYVQHFGTDEG
jgi:hypothetical protein